MIEIISIALSIPLFFLVFSFPLNCFNYQKFKIKKLNFFETILINVVLHSNIFLLTSFSNFNLQYIFAAYIMLGVFFFILYFKRYIQYFVDNYLYFILFFILCYSFFVEISQNAHMTYDGVAHWFYKVQNFYQGGSVDNLNNLAFSHYPHLGSYIWAFFWKNSFLNYEYFGRFFYVFIFLISIFSIISSQKEFSDTEKHFLIFGAVIISADFYLFGGYQEYLIFFCLVSFVHIFLLLKKNNIFFLQLLLLLIANIILWTKQEGFFYYIILSLIFNIHFKQEKKKKILFIALYSFVFMLFIVSKIYFFGSFRLTEKVSLYEFFINFNFFIFLNKIILIFKYFFISFLKHPMWILIILSLIFLAKEKKFLLNNIFFITFLILTFGFVIFIYILTKFDLQWLLSVSLSRLVFPLSGFAMYLVLQVLKIYKKK
tara:strand:+ start:2214 stop:3500 length:1287 start_codon:yes stop_codon:yes gene_type:complete